MGGQVKDAVNWAKENKVKWRVIGGGSNIIFTDEGFNGLIILNEIKGVTFLKEKQGYRLQAGAGENWDIVVRLACEKDLYGIAELSLIPGTVGATPVQNVGAYGREISDIMYSLEAYDTENEKWVTLMPEDCDFSYRSSIFNESDKGRYIIVNVTYMLSTRPLDTPVYASLKEYLNKFHIKDRSPLAIRGAVCVIRQEKLPDPSKIANTGSFFKNPIVEPEKAAKILGEYPDAPHFHLPDGKIKLSAGWLIEKAGLKNYAGDGVRTYKKNALVIINESATSYFSLEGFKEEIVKKVKEFSDITLSQEPEIIKS
jgi:UDP-N-acetylmuramate dehydrogenase